MPPRRSKVVNSSDGEDEDYDVKPTSSKRSKDKEEEEEAREISEPKTKKSRPSTSNNEIGQAELEKNDDGDSFFKLTENRRVTVRKFKNMTLIDIRETYKDKQTNKLKPGAKGISLTKEQWDVLKNNINNVDDMIAKVNEK
ncbi:uncharacterized protein L201_004412 [Kwoniella dendrophila CBS 6074]|uniref:Transcriptional coactivator p15 (PC4) C-terminal domain-containing protein n=1 Tax=Kwoniella dendrophila CBS 6074 TaxID=1295534 RepID=A0AAX4JY87_9TREE